MKFTWVRTEQGYGVAVDGVVVLDGFEYATLAALRAIELEELLWPRH